MLHTLPTIVQIIVLVLVGLVSGAFINWAILNWGFHRWPYSPWGRPRDPAIPRASGADYLPVIGWLAMRRTGDAFGRLFWLRPLLIELAWSIGLPLFFYWQLSGGLTGGVVPPAAQAEIWFWGHSILIGLMTIATFIDLDQRLIPDPITVPGTLIALGFAAMWPEFRLPQVVQGLAAVPEIQSLHFMSPDPLPQWHRGPVGLAIMVGVWGGWILALYPKTIVAGRGLRGIAIALASMMRVLRPRRLKVRAWFRRQALALLAIGAVGLVLIPWLWFSFNAEHQDSFFGAFAGLGFAGLMVWLIRIVGGYALGQEAMGFGDVTLMAMIGAFLGWQPALLIFAFAPFAGLLVTVANYLVTRENELAFGPYLCVSAVGVLFFWHRVWDWASHGVFAIGTKTLAAVLLVGLVLFALMLAAIGWMKGLGHEDDSRN